MSEAERAGSDQSSAPGLMTWAAICIALLLGITMSYIPYEFAGRGYELVFSQIRIIGLLFLCSGILLLLPRLVPYFWRLDIPARLLLCVTLVWFWLRFAVGSMLPVATVSFALLIVALLLEPFLDRRGVVTFRWYLTALALALGMVMVLAPGGFPADIYGSLAAIGQPFGVLLVLGGLGLLATARQGSGTPAGRVAEVFTAVLYLVVAATAVEGRRWIGLQIFAVLGVLDLFLPYWSRLARPPSLANRLIRAFTLAVLVPLLLLGGAASYLMQQALQQQVFARNTAIVNGATELVRQYVQDGQTAALIVARAPVTVAAIATWDMTILEGQIRTLYEESGLFRGIWVLDSGGTVRVTYPPQPSAIGTSLADAPYFRSAVRYGDPVTGEVFRSPLAGQPLVVPYAIPIQSPEGQTLGVMVAFIDLGELSGRIATVPVGEAGEVRLIDRNGRIIAASNAARVGQPIEPTDTAAQEALAGGTGVMEVADPRGFRQLAAYGYVPDLGWALVAEVPTGEAYRPITTLTGLFLIFLAGAALIAIGIASFTALEITRPLRELRAAARALSEGDLTRRVAITTGDELEWLGSSFNEMASQLQRHRAEVLELLGREQALARIAQALVRELELGRVVDVVLDQSRQTLGVDAVLLWLSDPGRRNLTLLAYRNVTPESVELIRSLSYDAPSVSARAARTREIQVIEDLPTVTSDLPLARQLHEREGTRGLLAVPLIGRRDLVGVVTYTTRTARRFSERDLELNATLADLFAVAIENAHLYDEIRQSLRLREEFMSAAAHELKTPVTTIKGLAEQLLRTGDHSALERRILTTIDRQTDRITRVVEDLLAVVRLRPGFLVLHRESLELGALARALVEQMVRLQEQFRITVEAPGPVVVDADRQLIEETIRHLLGNAMRYSPAGGAIEVVVGRSDGEALVTVRDYGFGIPPERQPHIFEPFYEPLPSGTPGYVGIVSLGLYLSKRTIEAHGGRIWFESTPGVGSVFCFSLPLVKRVEEAERQ